MPKLRFLAGASALAITAVASTAFAQVTQIYVAGMPSPRL